MSAAHVELVRSARVAHLATADATGVPHVVPICFANDGDLFYLVLDSKPKRAPLSKLKRVRNILSNPNVSLLLDYYDEDWARLWYLLVRATAEVIYQGTEHQRAIALLKEKYLQYRTMDIAGNPVIKITASRASYWTGTPGQGDEGAKDK